MSAPRCKPGQLARYIGNDPQCIGWIVLCVEVDPLFSHIAGTPIWVTDPSLPKDGGGGVVLGTADYLLKPLDNPGDDEVDEISLRRDVPEGVPA